MVAGWRDGWRRPTLRLLAIAGVSALLAAPELVPLIRFRSLYFFIRYTSYGSVIDYVVASIDAVSVPGFLFAIAGVVAAALVPPRHLLTRTVAVALGAYVVTTLVFSFGATTLIEQLEATRLMPVQRLLSIYAAAVGLHVVCTIATTRWRLPAAAVGALQAAAVGALLVAYLGPDRLMPFWSRGLYPVQRSAVPQMAIFQQVLRVAEDTAPPGTAILVVGSAVGNHQQLWAPVRSGRLFFYDEWMWYWQKKHRGPYDPEHTSKYEPARIGEAFDRDFLDRHAIGAVVVEATMQTEADSATALRRMFGGTFGVYAVEWPMPVVTLAGHAPDALAIANERITTQGTSGGGEALIRRNWFPRWRAVVNDEPAPLTETEDGYMRVSIPPGDVRVELTYALDRVDVAARGAASVGVGVLLWMLPWRRRTGEPSIDRKRQLAINRVVHTGAARS